jgi:predicted DNA-binding protein
MRIRLLDKPIALTVDISPELRKELINMASYKETTLTSYVIEAIEAQLNHDKGNQFAEKNVAQASVSPEEALKVLKEFVDASE